MKVFIQQPQFLPWSGFWNKVYTCDVYVMYAGVQYIRLEYQNRVLLNNKWLSLPVFNSLGGLIRDVKIDPRDVNRVEKTIRQVLYRKEFLYCERLNGLLDLLKSWKSDSFLDFHISTYKCLSKELGINTKLVVDTECIGEDKYKKLENTLNKYELKGCILLEGENCRHFNYESIPNIERIKYQVLSKERSPNTVLEILVKEDNPLECIKKFASWTE